MWSLVLLALADTGEATPRDSAAIRALAAVHWQMDSSVVLSIPITIKGDTAWMRVGDFVSDSRLRFWRKKGKWERDSIEVRAIR